MDADALSRQAVDALCPELKTALLSLAKQEGDGRAAGAELIERVKHLRRNMDLAASRLARSIQRIPSDSPERDALGAEYTRAVELRTLADNALGVSFAQDRQIPSPAQKPQKTGTGAGGFRERRREITASNDGKRRRRQ